MLNQHTVLGQLRLLMELDDQQAHDALPFCAAAAEQLIPRLKRGIPTHDPRLSRAAATAALCMMLTRLENEQGDGIESFKAGDITVSKHGRASRDRLRIAIEERNAAMLDIAPLLADTSFNVKSTNVK